MSGKCDICGKSPQAGMAVSHSKRHTKRTWTPNIHPSTMMIDGRLRKANLCTRCIRTQSKLAEKKVAAAAVS